MNVAGAEFYCDESIDSASINVIRKFAGQLSFVTGKESVMYDGISSSGFNFYLDTTLAKEAYNIEIGSKCVIVKASSLNGYNYAVQTIKQMLPPQIFGDAVADKLNWTLQCASIKDKPRFGYRGMHLDVSRHFFDIDMVKRYLDIMEIHKLNTLHWHLTDDQGWRIEIKKYPRLTEYGSIRKQTLVGHLFESNNFHIGGDECPKVRWESCSRCQAKIKELGLKDKDGYKAEHYLQSYVMKRMTDFLEKKGKKIIGWDEILEGDIAENAIVMSWRG